MKFWTVGCNIMHKVMWNDINKLEDAVYIDSIFRSVCKIKLWVCRLFIELDKKEKLPI